jgi:uncharacterized C2H2 Zn-finger protein
LEYKWIYRSVNGWYGETFDGDQVKLKLVPKGRKTEHLKDSTDQVVGKRCSKCGKMTLATAEYFRVDNRAHAGLQQKCKNCHSRWDEVNMVGRSIKGGPVRTQRPKALRLYDEEGLCTFKVCPCCGEGREREEYARHSRNPDGLQTYCKKCQAENAKKEPNPQEVN